METIEVQRHPLSSLYDAGVVAAHDLAVGLSDDAADAEQAVVDGFRLAGPAPAGDRADVVRLLTDVRRSIRTPSRDGGAVGRAASRLAVRHGLSCAEVATVLGLDVHAAAVGIRDGLRARLRER